MKKLLVYGIISMILFISTAGAANFITYHNHNVKALSATKFEVTNSDFENSKIVDLKGKKFFVVSVREPGSDGSVYAIDEDGTIWWHGTISSGAAGGHETTNGIFNVLAKRRFHMSKTHPSANGVNNMDFEVQFTQDGEALHLGNTAMMSHGCIHVGRSDIAPLFKWADMSTKVVVLRGRYNQFLKEEVTQFKEDIKEYNAEMGN